MTSSSTLSSIRVKPQPGMPQSPVQGEQLPEGSGGQVPRVFMSYRRDDSAGDTGRLYDALTARFGRDSVFMDVDAIAPGADFADAIRQAVSSCQVFIAVIGKTWIGSADAGGHRRLDDDRDFVRLEIQAALERNLRVIPVLVQGASMPSADQLPDAIGRLAVRNAFELTYGRWHYDAARLIATIEELGAQIGKELSNLPEQLTSFVGRRMEIQAVEHALANTRLITLTGAGGIGKTRLAIEVARRVASRYQDGVRMVELGSLADPDLLPHSVAFAMGLADRAGHSITQTLTDYLRHRQLLLILDNCEHLVDAAARLADSLLRAAPELRLLATSREALQIDGETAWRVPSLSVPEPGSVSEGLSDYGSVTLFAERAQAAVASFRLSPQTAPTVAQICLRLDGIPLAIELAAARLKVISLDQILIRLDTCFRLLTGGSRTALPRQQTLRATIDWSYELLSERERVLLRRLSIFAGGASLEATEAVCADAMISPPDALDLLSGLVSKSLVLADTGGVETRFRLLETVRQYGQERLAEAGEVSQVEKHHRTWFAQLAGRAEPALRGPEQRKWSKLLEAEHDNLRAAFEGHLRHRELEACLQMAGAMGWFWHMTGRLSEAREAIERALMEGAGVPATLRARALCWDAFIAGDQDNSSDALHLAEQSLALYREIGDQWGIAFAMQTLARTAITQDDFRRAEELLEPTLSMFRQTNDKWALSRSLLLLGLRASVMGDYVRAAALEEEALALSRQLGDTWHIAWTLSTLGQVELWQGKFDLAKKYLEETLTVLGGDANWQAAMALHRLGVVARCQQDAEGAARLQQQSLSLLRESGDKVTRGYALREMGGLAQTQGNFEQAKAFLNEGLALVQIAGDRFGTIKGLEAQAALAGDQNDTWRAIALFGAADALRDEIGAPVAPYERHAYDTQLRLARTGLGTSESAAAWAWGRALSREELVEFALGDVKAPLLA